MDKGILTALLIGTGIAAHIWGDAVRRLGTLIGVKAVVWDFGRGYAVGHGALLISVTAVSTTEKITESAKAAHSAYSISAIALLCRVEKRANRGYIINAVAF